MIYPRGMTQTPDRPGSWRACAGHEVAVEPIGRGTPRRAEGAAGRGGSRSSRPFGLAAGALLCTLVLVFSASDASAQAREDGAPVEALGMGDNVRASVWGPASLYYNPAAMSRIRVFLLQATYTYLDGRDGHGVGVAAADSALNQAIAMGLAYNYMTGAPGGFDRDGHQLRLGLSTGYVSGDFALYAGVGGRYLDLSYASAPGSPADVSAWTIDAGLLIDFANRIRFGVVGANLIDTGSAEAARKIGLGMSFVFGTLEVTGDLELDLASQHTDTVLRYGFGAQYGFAGSFHGRVGLIIDELLDEERVTAGFGYSTPEFAVDIGYSTAVRDETDMAFGVSLRFAPAIAR